ncbi:hypothetical protein DCAR_0518741 [Daucus carota subsp. sativus]|uniref:Uncharacterized protein n=1 Tax=Daucus carota subsp. sativus TaxID=79200 RepID=A0AAF0X341_DAUCS|nr:hypothetical protein DCAR_0518741 [Daucus carota subsp. sativus]
MLGWMKTSINPRIGGVTGKECNSISTKPKSKQTGTICYTNDAEYVNPDPGHTFEAVEQQRYQTLDTNNFVIKPSSIGCLLKIKFHPVTGLDKC